MRRVIALYLICRTAWSVWYINSSVQNLIKENCLYECDTTIDCPNGLSCFQASQNKKGCCLHVLRPNETGCLIDEQCTRACATSYCKKNDTVGRCACQQGYNFLFGKCWKDCPYFASRKVYMDAVDGLETQCILNSNDLDTELLGSGRYRRSLSYC
ncbi:unnamed protein product [Bursaphelenchus xylophilus]|uniref:(pine wood nematode) hypothetical protein n=1 Tax=Bursaphelenchus xylophilus TaxID=6326 RepID=A0A1I7SQJ6_BURXY|nr:unnamed protein product [Bursaphelenchus xylophilus]CAG9109998.1 unnamed protein product [Bursaphelenchus xylophilus]